jgi:hypothetical protein
MTRRKEHEETSKNTGPTFGGTRSAPGLPSTSRPIHENDRAVTFDEADVAYRGSCLPHGMGKRGYDYLPELGVPDLDRYGQFPVNKLLRPFYRL